MTDVATQPLSFEYEAKQTVGNFRQAIIDALDALPSAAHRGTEIAASLGIDRNLAWRISRVVQEADPFSALQHIPRKPGMRILLRAIADAGVRPGIVERLEQCAGVCERFMKAHAGDRTSLDMMLTPRDAEARLPIDVAHRKLAFRGNSYIWGRQAKARVSSWFVQPSHDPNRIDVVVLKGLYGLRRLRGDMPVTLHRTRFCETSDPATPTASAVGQPLDPEVPHAELCLLPQFCSATMPPIRIVRESNGATSWELLPGGVGNTAAVTCVSAQVFRSAAERFRSGSNVRGETCCVMTIPCESLVMDLIIREDTAGSLNPEAAAYSELREGGSYPEPECARDQLEIPERVSYLGRGSAVLRSPHVPRYSKLAEYIFERLGWDSSRFDVYRLRMDFPIMPATVVVRHDLPASPSDSTR